MENINIDDIFKTFPEHPEPVEKDSPDEKKDQKSVNISETMSQKSKGSRRSSKIFIK